MIIYIYQGMMALGKKKGGIHHGRAKREKQEEEAGVRNVRRTWDEINADQRVAPTEFSLIFSIFKESSVTDGCHNPISSFVPSPNSSYHQAH